MILKEQNIPRTHLSPFDLLGYDEDGLSKAFAYLLADNEQLFRDFLRLFELKYIKTFRQSIISIQKHSHVGRTDIEIENQDFHIVVECKIRSNRIQKQRTQYHQLFKKSTNNIMCFLTEEYDSDYFEKMPNVTHYYMTWFDILQLMSGKKYSSNLHIKHFVHLAERTLGMNDSSEILIQDLGKPSEIELYTQYNLYRRNPTYGHAFYFAPYFTRKSGRKEGISSIKKIFGIITTNLKKNEIGEQSLARFTEDRALIKKWLTGLSHASDDKERTFYFLGNEFTFRTPLRKDPGNKKGRGKNWVAAMIPKNRRVGFIDLLNHIPELK